MKLFHEAVFTTRERSVIADGDFKIHQRWTRAKVSFDQATQKGLSMPILFGEAAWSVSTLINWATITDLTIDGDYTHVRYNNIRDLRGCDISKLKKLSDDELISPDYRRSYIPCHTPEFLSEPDENQSRTGAQVESDVPELLSAEGLEGQRRERLHMSYERNTTLIKQAKKAWSKRDPTLACVVCSFSFLQCYGIPFIEAHHRVPLASPGGTTRRTTLADLVAVCANCHRMLHRMQDLSPEGLRDKLNATRGRR